MSAAPPTALKLPPLDPATGAVRILHVPDFRLECGRRVDVEQAFTLFGQVAPDGDNVVVLCHALTGGPDPRVWWPKLVGAGRLLDPSRYAILTPNHIGSCYGTRFAAADGAGDEGLSFTSRDMARLTWAVLDGIGVRGVRLVTGGSLGGMVAMEFAVHRPERVGAAAIFAAPAAHTAHAIGHNHVQRQIVGMGGDAGLELARMAAMLTYRSPADLERRFARTRHEGGFAVQRYLEHHGRKLRRRFDAAAYVRLLDAMDAHDVGRGRGGIRRALRRYQGTLVGVGITTDQLYSPADVEAWVSAGRGAYRSIDSIHGHDAFLVESLHVESILEEALATGGRTA